MTGKVMFNTFLNFISALNRPAGRFYGSQLCHCFKLLMSCRKHGGKKRIFHKTVSVVDELWDLKIKFRFSG